MYTKAYKKLGEYNHSHLEVHLIDRKQHSKLTKTMFLPDVTCAFLKINLEIWLNLYGIFSFEKITVIQQNGDISINKKTTKITMQYIKQTRPGSGKKIGLFCRCGQHVHVWKIWFI